MEDYRYTQCSFNLANKDAIVYQHTDYDSTLVTVEDFAGDEELFRHWKDFSDDYYVAERNHTYRTSYKDVSINDLENTEQLSVPSPEEEMIRREDDLQFRREMKEFLGTLSETQRRRFLLHALGGMSQENIALIEGIGQPRVHKTLEQVSQKFQIFMKQRKESCGNCILSDRSRFYRRKQEESSEE